MMMMNEAEAVLETLKGSLEDVASGKKDVKEELGHIMSAAKYLQKNWKKALPAIAAMGASAYLMQLRNKAGKTAKSAKKSAKKVAKKATKKVAKVAKSVKKKSR